MAGASSQHLSSGRGSTSVLSQQRELQLPLIGEVEKKFVVVMVCFVLFLLFAICEDVPETGPVNKM